MPDPLFPATGAAVVIGGSGGVGAEICRVLARDGCDVALTYFAILKARRRQEVSIFHGLS